MNGRIEHDEKLEEKITALLETVPEYMEEWNLNMKASDKTPVTRLNYLIRIRCFLRFINPNAMEVKLSDINSTNTQKWYISKQTKKKDGKVVEASCSQKCTTWAALNSFFTYMVKREYMTENYVLLIEKPKNHDLERINQNRVLLTEDDFNKMLDAVRHDTWGDYDLMERNEAILLLFMMTGMRKTALTEINIEDLDMHRKEIRIIDKRKKLHVYKISKTLYAALYTWLQQREVLLERNNTECDALLITKEGVRIGAKGVGDVVKRYSRKGLGYEISPHKLRAGFISILYEKKHDIEFVRRAVGHADVSTTQRYIVTGGKEKEEASNIMDDLLD